MSLQIDLTDKRAFVSGVTSGIGAAIAEVLAKAGCDVAGCGRSESNSSGAKAFVKAVEANDRKAVYCQGDVSKKLIPETLVRSAVSELGGLDILVSNAGRNVFKGAADCSEDDWDDCMNLDLASHWRLAQAAKPELDKAEPGVIIIIGSNHGWNTIPGCFPYNVAKAGLLGMVQSLAIEWGPKIRAIGVAPGFIDTAGNQTWFDSFDDPAAERIRTEELHPVGRLGSVEEIGGLCAFLASPMADFISGTTLCVDGGRSALMQDS
ncbi:SDR family NAD(P)-dependent oxidoreductase [Rubellicoccus peritrichatus]|uniref:SDR family oxidoreductase n=1 Tax=Rubellicoccus peritrichatus TaxID=3080537 RepID=A0AAQ3LCC3_9BACT|nr:SDR family oxidoreductase [Puniceicoccus sp. CR14]WOO43191.1 SDR family oxidoreductase [Puniceicoccus sp. CR14]